MLTIKETVANKISEINAEAVAAPVWEDSESEAETPEGAENRNKNHRNVFWHRWARTWH